MSVAAACPGVPFCLIASELYSVLLKLNSHGSLYCLACKWRLTVRRQGPLISKGQLYDIKIQTKRFAFLETRFHTSECTQPNRNKQRKQNIMIGFVEGVKYNLETAKSFCLEQNCIFRFTKLGGSPRDDFCDDFH